MEEERSTEKKIMEAAEEVFLVEGYAGARMQEIANKAGINKAMLHYYFRTKDKLFELVLKHKLSQFIPQLSSTLHDDRIDFLTKVDGFIMAYLTMLRKNPSLPLFIISTMNRNPELMVHFHLQVGKDILDVMKTEIEKGNVRAVDPQQFILTLMGMCIFPFLARPMFRGIMGISHAEYDQILAERHVHVIEYCRLILG